MVDKCNLWLKISFENTSVNSGGKNATYGCEVIWHLKGVLVIMIMYYNIGTEGSGSSFRMAVVSS